MNTTLEINMKIKNNARCNLGYSIVTKKGERKELVVIAGSTLELPDAEYLPFVKEVAAALQDGALTIVEAPRTDLTFDEVRACVKMGSGMEIPDEMSIDQAQAIALSLGIKLVKPKAAATPAPKTPETK